VENKITKKWIFISNKDKDTNTSERNVFVAAVSDFKTIPMKQTTRKACTLI
jgi:hypothetical protein